MFERSLLCLDLPLRTIKFYFVVYGVTLRLFVINTSSSSIANNRRRLPAMIVVTNLPWSGASVCITCCRLQRWQHALKLYRSKIAIFVEKN